MSDSSPASSSIATTPTSEMNAEDLVPHWLTEANLGYAIPNFEMAGITSPRSFVEVPLNFFEPLGVTKTEDRKKLFYLIQSVKQALKREEESIVRAKAGGGVEGSSASEEVGGDGIAQQEQQTRQRRGRAESKLSEEEEEDDYADEEFQSPPKGEDQRDVMSTVEITRHQPISPVTLSSPIASSVFSEDGPAAACAAAVGHGSVRPAATTTKPKPLVMDSIASESASSVNTRNAAAADASLTPREQLQKELELRALKRREEKLSKSKLDGHGGVRSHEKEEDDGGYNDDDDFELEKDITKLYGKKKESKRRKSFLPSVQQHAGSTRSYSSRRSSTSSYRSTALDRMHGLDNDDENMEEYKSSGQEDGGLSLVTPKNASSSSVVDVRSRRSSIHHRQTVKKTNATNKAIGVGAGVAGAKAKKHRRYSSIPRASAPLLDDDDDESTMSDTSDLSASVASYHSLGSSISRRSSTSYSSSRSGISGARGGTAGGLMDENQNYGNVERKGRRNSQIMASKLSKGGISGGSSIASSLRAGKKRLSTIPSSSIAPLSPLQGLSSSQLDESMATQSLAAAGGGSRGPVLRRRSSIGSGRSVSSNRPRTADSSGSRATTVSRPSSRGSNSIDDLLLQKKKKRLNVSSLSSKTDVSVKSSSVRSQRSGQQRQRRLKSPTPATMRGNNDQSSLARARSKSPLPGSRGGGGPKSPYSPSRATSTPRSPPSRATTPRSPPSRAISSPRPQPTQRNVRTPPRSARSVSPKRTHRSSPKTLDVVGRSPVRSPARSRATSPKSPQRVKSPVGGNSSGNAVFVHGAPEDDSWATQVLRLRQDFDSEHAEYIASGNHQQSDERSEDELYEMRIRVIVRKRPMSNRESHEADVDVIHPLEYKDYGRILVHQPKTKLDLTKEIETTAFAFDNVFDEDSNNVQIYERAVQSLIPGVFRGKWASVFAYGQTGSGKTFTMMGSNATGMRAGNQAANSITTANRGLYYLAAEDVFRIATDSAYADISIGVSLFEIYGGKLLDLLNARHPVRCLEDRKGKVCFPGLSEHPVNNAEELMDIIDAGALNRSTGTTSANADSSRSHAVLQLSLRKDVGRVKNKEHGRLTFIDLAGSERGADTSKACRTTRMEGAEINTSLLALKEVIRALATGSSLKRIPFRGSKLTQVLKESFVGKNSRTVMVSCVAPNMKNCDHTLNTLRYADRVKERNPQTGQLSASVAASSRIKRDHADNIARVKLPPRPLTAPAASFRIEREDDSSDDDVPPPPSNEERLLQSLDEGPFVEDDEFKENDVVDKSGYSEFDYGKYVDSESDEDSLDKALKSNDNISISHHDESTKPHKLSKDSPEVQSLIATHKSINLKLLQMLQAEMMLVNETDVNRENISEYLNELENLSSQKLSLLSTLRESLASCTNGTGAHTSVLSDTMDSFDLRD